MQMHEIEKKIWNLKFNQYLTAFSWLDRHVACKAGSPIPGHNGGEVEIGDKFNLPVFAHVPQ